MIRQTVLALAAIMLAGALGASLRAQNPIKTAKPPASTGRVQPTATGQPPAPPPPSGGSVVCRASDMSSHMDSPHALMMSCLNKQIQVNSDQVSYEVVTVTDGGFQLKVVGETSGKTTARLVPWTAVLSYNLIAGTLNVLLVR
jgi:hypothetical protein